MSLYYFWFRFTFICSVEGLSLLGAYEDSEDEDAAENTSTATKAKHNQSADIDSTLANFMAVSESHGLLKTRRIDLSSLYKNLSVFLTLTIKCLS